MLYLKKTLITQDTASLVKILPKIENNPYLENSAQGLFLVGLGYLKLKNKSKAKFYLEKALTLDPKNKKILEYLQKLKS